MRSLSLAAAFVALLLLLLAAAAGGRLSAEEKKAKDDGRPGGALIVISGIVSKDGVGEMEAIRVINPDKVAALEAFFPGYRRQPASDLAGGWETGYQVYFDFPNGKSLRVVVSENEDARHWTMGRGDFETRGDFKAFVAGLRAEAGGSPRRP